MWSESGSQMKTSGHGTQNEEAKHTREKFITKSSLDFLAHSKSQQTRALRKRNCITKSLLSKLTSNQKQVCGIFFVVNFSNGNSLNSSSITLSNESEFKLNWQLLFFFTQQFSLWTWFVCDGLKVISSLSLSWHLLNRTCPWRDTQHSLAHKCRYDIWRGAEERTGGIVNTREKRISWELIIYFFSERYWLLAARNTTTFDSSFDSCLNECFGEYNMRSREMMESEGKDKCVHKHNRGGILKKS